MFPFGQHPSKKWMNCIRENMFASKKRTFLHQSKREWYIASNAIANPPLYNSIRFNQFFLLYIWIVGSGQYTGFKQETGHRFQMSIYWLQPRDWSLVTMIETLALTIDLSEVNMQASTKYWSQVIMNNTLASTKYWSQVTMVSTLASTKY